MDRELVRLPGLDDNDASGFSVHKVRPVRSFFGKHWKGGKTLYWRQGRLEQLMRELASGMNLKEACAASKSSVNVAMAARKILVKAQGQIYCSCGAPSNHRGVCKDRIKRNPHLEAGYRRSLASRCVMSARDVLEARKKYATWGHSVASLAKEYGVSWSGMFSAIRGTSWKQLPHAVVKRRPHNWDKHRRKNAHRSIAVNAVRLRKMPPLLVAIKGPRAALAARNIPQLARRDGPRPQGLLRLGAR